jgi:hypothetical protein
LQLQLLGVLPYTDRPQHARRQHRGEGFPRSAPAPDPGPRHLHAGHRLARTAGTRQTHPGARSRPRFRCRPHAFGTSAVVHPRSPSRLAPDASCAPFPQCSPPRLIHRSSLRWFRTSPCMSGPGGPTSITSAAPQPATRSSTSHPPAVFVAHGSRRPWPGRTGRARQSSRTCGAPLSRRIALSWVLTVPEREVPAQPDVQLGPLEDQVNSHDRILGTHRVITAAERKPAGQRDTPVLALYRG